MAALHEAGLISKPQFDDKIEWTWFYLWHHEGRCARHYFFWLFSLAKEKGENLF